MRATILNLIWPHPTTALALLLVFLYDFTVPGVLPHPPLTRVRRISGLTEINPSVRDQAPVAVPNCDRGF